MLIECITHEFIKLPSEIASIRGIINPSIIPFSFLHSPLSHSLSQIHRLGCYAAPEPYKTPLLQAVRLVAVLCQGSRSVCEAAAKSGLLGDLTRFVDASIFPLPPPPPPPFPLTSSHAPLQCCFILLFQSSFVNICTITVKITRTELAIDLFCEALFAWRVASAFGIWSLESVERVAFLLEFVQNWSPSAVPDMGVLFFCFFISFPFYF